MKKNINTNIEDLKRVIEKSDRDKENMKLKIQKIFTQIRNALNKREDQLLINIDKKFDRYLIKKELLKEGIDLPKKIKANLEKANIIDKEWAKNKLSLLMNDYSKIENDLSKINYTYNEINSINSNNIQINFYPNDYEINQLLNTLKSFGKISHKEYKYSFKECPVNMEENKKYIVSGIDNTYEIFYGIW